MAGAVRPDDKAADRAALEAANKRLQEQRIMREEAKQTASKESKADYTRRLERLRVEAEQRGASEADEQRESNRHAAKATRDLDTATKPKTRTKAKRKDRTKKTKTATTQAQDTTRASQQRRTTPRAAFEPVKRASLPRLSNLSSDEATLPGFPDDNAPAPDGQLLLPGFGDAVRGCASWLLWLFDQAGGKSLSSGVGAPWDLRLFVYALLHLDVADRDGEWHTVRIAASPDHAKNLENATGNRIPNIEDWLHPNGWSNKRRDWHRLPEALHRMRRDLGYVPVPGIGYVAMLFPSVIPSSKSDPLVEFTIRVPSVAAYGDRLRWPRLLKYGVESARVFRAYLAVTAWLGRSAHRGHAITSTISAPVLNPGGKPVRRKGGTIVRSATERIDNPAAHYAGPPLSEEDLTRMIGFDSTDRFRRRDTRAAFERMEADGVIEIDRAEDGFLIYGGPSW